MNTGKLILVAAALFQALLLSSPPAHCAGERMMTIVSIPPQKYFVRKIGGDHVRVKAMVRPGASPATYEPTPKQMVGLTEAEVYFAIGVPFENSWLPKINDINPELEVVNTYKGIAKLPMLEKQNQKADKQAIRDPHIWLSPSLVRIQAENIRDALIRTDPKNQNDYMRNFAAFAREINEVDEKLLNMFCENPGKNKFMVFHPSWGYLARSYGLRQLAIERGGKRPGPRLLSAMVREAKQMGIKTVFVQPQFSTKSARVIADAIKGKVVEIDPLAENWEENLLQAAEKIQKALR